MPPKKDAPPFHEFGDRIVYNMWEKLGKDCTATSAHFEKEAAAMLPIKRGPTRKMVDRQVKRHESGGTLDYLAQRNDPPAGRPPALDEIGKNVIKAEEQ